MRRSRFMEEQVIGILREAEPGVSFPTEKVIEALERLREEGGLPFRQTC